MNSLYLYKQYHQSDQKTQAVRYKGENCVVVVPVKKAGNIYELLMESTWLCRHRNPFKKNQKSYFFADTQIQ